MASNFAPTPTTLMVTGGKDMMLMVNLLNGKNLVRILFPSPITHVATASLPYSGTSQLDGPGNTYTMFIGSCVDGNSYMLNGSTGAVAADFKGHAGGANTVAVNTEANIIASGGNDNCVRTWIRETADPWVWVRGKVLEKHVGSVLCVAFSSKLPLLASASADATTIIWSTMTWQPLKQLTGHTADVTCFAFVPKSDTCLTGSSDTTLRLWSINTGVCLHVNTGHNAPVTAIAVSNSGMNFISGSSDSTVRFHDISSMACIKIVRRDAPITALSYTLDDTSVAIGCQDGSTIKTSAFLPAPGNTIPYVRQTGAVQAIAFAKMIFTGPSMEKIPAAEHGHAALGMLIEPTLSGTSTNLPSPIQHQRRASPAQPRVCRAARLSSSSLRQMCQRALQSMPCR